MWGKESDSEVGQSCPTLRPRGGYTPCAVAPQAPLSVGFSRQGYWSGLPFPSPGDLPNPGIKPESPALQADALPSEAPGKPQGHLLFRFFLPERDWAANPVLPPTFWAVLHRLRLQMGKQRARVTCPRLQIVERTRAKI